MPRNPAPPRYLCLYCIPVGCLCIEHSGEHRKFFKPCTDHSFERRCGGANQGCPTRVKRTASNLPCGLAELMHLLFYRLNVSAFYGTILARLIMRLSLVYGNCINEGLGVCNPKFSIQVSIRFIIQSRNSIRIFMMVGLYEFKSRYEAVKAIETDKDKIIEV